MKRHTKIILRLILLALLFATPVTANSDHESKWYERQHDLVGSKIGQETIMICTHPDKKSNCTLHISTRLLDLRKFSADGPEDGMSGQHPAKILFSMGMKLATRSF